jgi:hypothetical protein
VHSPTTGKDANCRRLPTALLQLDAIAQAKDVMQINPSCSRASSYSRTTLSCGTVSHFQKFVQIADESMKACSVSPEKTRHFRVACEIGTESHSRQQVFCQIAGVDRWNLVRKLLLIETGAAD